MRGGRGHHNGDRMESKLTLFEHPGSLPFASDDIAGRSSSRTNTYTTATSNCPHIYGIMHTAGSIPRCPRDKVSRSSK